MNDWQVMVLGGLLTFIAAEIHYSRKEQEKLRQLLTDMWAQRDRRPDYDL